MKHMLKTAKWSCLNLNIIERRCGGMGLLKQWIEKKDHRCLKMVALAAFTLGSWGVEASVKSTTGNIHFYPTYSGASQATLNATGLGLGTDNPAAKLQVQGNAVITEGLSIGGAVGSSNLNIQGSISQSFQSVSSDVTIPESGAHSLILADSSSSNVRITLPYAANVSGRIIKIKQTSNLNEVKVTAHAGSKIDAKESLKLTQYASTEIISQNNQWWNMSSMGNVENLTDSAYALYSDNLIGYWTLDGDGLDSKGSNHLSSSTSPNTYAVGKRGQCAQFDKTKKQYLHVDFSPSLAAPDHLSLSFWVKGVTEGWGTMVCVAKGNLGDNYLLSGRAGSSVSYWLMYNNGNKSKDFTASEDLSGSTWQYVTMVLSSGQLNKIYVNGVYKNQMNPPYTKDGTALYGIFIGATNWNNGGVRDTKSYLNGYVDDVRLYNKALSDAEVLSLYQSY